MNIKQIQKKYDTQAKCLSYLEKLRWGKNVKCPYCDSKRVHAYKDQAHRYKCYSCKKSFSVLVGTIFQDTKLKLPDWFMITSLILQFVCQLGLFQQGLANPHPHLHIQLLPLHSCV
jgi:DNA-directed RNA polymerase subunit RPC12/RpoP